MGGGHGGGGSKSIHFWKGLFTRIPQNFENQIHKSHGGKTKILKFNTTHQIQLKVCLHLHPLEELLWFEAISE